MGDTTDSAGEVFGNEYTTWNEWLGDFVGGPRWVYFPALTRNTDRERGFLSKADRRLLLETHSLDLSNKSQRNARTRVRNRVLSAYFDAQLLQFISDRDRELIFKNARKRGDGLDFREGFKQFVRFSILGLLEDDHEIDVTEILEEALQEAEEEYTRNQGENASIEVDINVRRADGASIETLERRYSACAPLTIDELAVLVQSEHSSNEATTNADEIDLADAIYYDARQPTSGPTHLQNGSRDRREAEEIVEWLRKFLDEYDIETRDELEETVARLKEFDEEKCDKLLDNLDRLIAVAPHFEEQLAEQSKLSERDAALLNDILWNPENLDVETALEKEARPRLAGDDWEPADDEDLQRFIARVEVARESGAVLTHGNDSGRERWEKVRSLAEFDKQEWSDYMQKQRVERCRSDLEDAIGREGVDKNVLREVDSWEGFLATRPEESQTFSQLGFVYSEDTMDAALEALAAELDSE